MKFGFSWRFYGESHISHLYISVTVVTIASVRATIKNKSGKMDLGMKNGTQSLFDPKFPAPWRSEEIWYNSNAIIPTLVSSLFLVLFFTR